MSEPLPEKLPTNSMDLLPAGWEEFNKFGHITKSFLNDKRFNGHNYHPLHLGRFNPLTRRIVGVCQTIDCPDIWFMPSVLKQVPAEKIEVSVSPGPLVADFPDGGPQNGIFCSLMSHVLSRKNRHPHLWKLCLSSNEPTCI